MVKAWPLFWRRSLVNPYSIGEVLQRVAVLAIAIGVPVLVVPAVIVFALEGFGRIGLTTAGRIVVMVGLGALGFGSRELTREPRPGFFAG